jgi:hypothetical protein
LGEHVVSGFSSGSATVDEGRAPLVSVGEFSVGKAEEEEGEPDEDEAEEDEVGAAEGVPDSAELDELCAAAPRASKAAR